MAFLSDNVIDGGLDYLIANCDAIYLCSQAPTTPTEAISTYALANKTAHTLTGPVNGDVSGRKATSPAITDGTVTGTGTATHYAFVKTTATQELLAWQTITPQAVTSGNTWTKPAHDVEFPDPA